MTEERPGRAHRRVRRQALIVAAAVVPPLVAGLLVLALRLTSDNVEQPPVEIREERRLVAYGTIDEALAAIQKRTGFVVDLPTRLPNGNYRLIYVDSVVPADGSGKGPAVVIAYQDRRDERGSWFSVSQRLAGSIDVPGGLPEIRVGVADATVWFVGGPAEPVGGNIRHMQFIARTAQYDRIVSFEGPLFPDQGRAKNIIESILRVEARRAGSAPSAARRPARARSPERSVARMRLARGRGRTGPLVA